MSSEELLGGEGPLWFMTLALRLGKPDGLPSMGSHRVGHDSNSSSKYFIVDQLVSVTAVDLSHCEMNMAVLQ